MGNLLLSSIKFCIAILLLPVVIAGVIGLHLQLLEYPGSNEHFFMWGIYGFFLSFFFLYQFWGVYEFGQKIMGSLLRFTSPFDRIASYIIPLYTLIIFLLYAIAVRFFKTHQYDPHFMFFIGFSIAMHIFLSAQDMQEREKTPIKPSYLFWISIVFIFNIFLFVLLLDAVLGYSNLAHFTNTLVADSRMIYGIAIRKLLLFG